VKHPDYNTGQYYPDVRVGTAGWTIPKALADRFSSTGSHLERYAQRFGAVEINSSFYRSHQPSTYARWAASVPEGFQFAVKVPKEITHVRRLVLTSTSTPLSHDTEEESGVSASPLDDFLAETSALGAKLGPWLVQLPPSLAFDTVTADAFFAALRERFAGNVACEPRHASWFTSEADALLNEYRIARVAADPALHPLAAQPGGWSGLVYYRLHGSPRTYYSAYALDFLDDLAKKLLRVAASGVPVWCIFDNTASGAATDNALSLQEQLCNSPS